MNSPVYLQMLVENNNLARHSEELSPQLNDMIERFSMSIEVGFRTIISILIKNLMVMKLNQFLNKDKNSSTLLLLKFDKITLLDLLKKIFLNVCYLIYPLIL